MKSISERLQELQERQQKELAMGGTDRVKKQHDSGKLTARERLDLLFDPGTFVETDMFVRHRATLFGWQRHLFRVRVW